MSHAGHVLADAALHSFVLERHSLISAVVVGVDRRGFRCIIADEALKRFGVRSLNHSGTHTVGIAVLGANNDRLADRAPASLQFLVGVLVVLLSANEGLVHLDGASKPIRINSTK